MKLIDEQIAIENNAHLEAKARYEKQRMKEDETLVVNGISNNLLSQLVPTLATQIERWWEPKASVGNPTKENIKKYFREMPLDSTGIAIATLKPLLTGLFQNKPLPVTALASSVFKCVFRENSYEEFKEYGRNNELTEQDKRDWRALSRKLVFDSKNRRSFDKYRVLRHAREVFTDLETQEPTEKVAHGIALLTQAMGLIIKLKSYDEPVKLFMRKLVRERGKSTAILSFTPEVIQHLGRIDEQVVSALFSFYPMVVPPTPWEGLFGGGYVTPRGRGNVPMIKSYKLHLYDRFDLKDNKSVDALNIIQSTKWVVNRKVYAVMNYCSENGMEVGGLPVNLKEFALPKRLLDEEWQALTTDEKQIVIEDRKKIHQEADSSSSKILSLKLKLSMIRRFLKYEELYFPHTFDFRGRVYPVPTPVNPQSDKFGQALLHFADAEPLGETGYKWLAIHGANCWGLDGESYDVRKQWVQDNAEGISATAENPLSRRDWWSEADDPFGFLAFCFEWGEMLKLENPYEFKSHLPVKLDATSSGLQHYSAIFRDEMGAVATNLANGERNDIYKLVAEETGSLISKDIEKSDREDRPWKRSLLSCLNRSLCKGITMCLPYGISMFGATDDLKKKYNDGEMPDVYLPKEPRQCLARIRILAGFMMQGVGNVVNSAIKGMAWLKEAEKAALKGGSNQPVQYVTKLGFPFIQQYYKTQTRRVNTFLGDVKIKLSTQKFSKRIDPRKSNSAIAPNFIHSQDATHLLKCALEGNKRGIKDFSFIHDSFGVHAGRTEEFREVIRESFVWLYSDDTFGEFKKQLEGQYPTAEIPEPPYEAYGNFDINECLKSEYMFN